MRGADVQRPSRSAPYGVGGGQALAPVSDKARLSAALALGPAAAARRADLQSRLLALEKQFDWRGLEFTPAAEARRGAILRELTAVGREAKRGACVLARCVEKCGAEAARDAGKLGGCAARG